MLLPADLQLAIEVQRARFDDRYVAVRDAMLVGEVAAGLDRLLDGENRGQRLILRQHAGRAEARGLDGFRQHPRHRLVVIHHFHGKQRLVVPVGARVPLARHVRVGEHPHNARRRHGRRDVEPGHQRVRVRRQHRPGVQQIRKPAGEVVGIERLAGDVLARALVRKRLAGQSS